MNPPFLQNLKILAENSREINEELALSILTDKRLDTNKIIEIASIPRKRYFDRSVHIHILNNIKNGYCPEDCSYCAQRKGGDVTEISSYPDKSDDEILKEAKEAWQSGAYRYCLVSAGRGPNQRSIQRFTTIIQKVKNKYPLMEVCLSAGLIEKIEHAKLLAKVGLDRYNHNLNTSKNHYSKICTTHTYEERVHTLSILRKAGISLCSGVIAGMGEAPLDLVSVALELQKNKAASIPINFFLPVPGHSVKGKHVLDADYCLRILSMFRLTNPKAEIRIAAGRELYLKERQQDAFAVANSLFVSGYLNVMGSSIAETISLIQKSGYEIQCNNAEFIASLSKNKTDTTQTPVKELTGIQMKSIQQLRPFF